MMRIVGGHELCLALNSHELVCYTSYKKWESVRLRPTYLKSPKFRANLHHDHEICGTLNLIQGL